MEKTLSIARPPQIAPMVGLKYEWRDEQGRRTTQYLTEVTFTEEQAKEVCAIIKERDAEIALLKK